MESNSIPAAADAMHQHHAFQYSKERRLLSRMVVALGLHPNPSMKIIAFWLWLEENGHRDIIRSISALDDASLLDVASVGNAFVESLHLHSLLGSRADEQQFRDVAVRGINHYLNTVCRRVFVHMRMEQLLGFDNYLEIQKNMKEVLHLDVSSSNARGRNSSSSGLFRSGRTVLDVLFSLYKQSSSPATENRLQLPRDERTLFVTFSNGFPLTEEELRAFFMRHYGDVETVSVQERLDGKPPLYAHVTFYSLATLSRVLNGNDKVKFMTKGKHLWVRRFIPKNKFKHAAA